MDRATRGVVAVTGAGGQVGRALLPRLRAAGYGTVALVRGGDPPPADRVVRGPLGAPDATIALAGADAVVHLAGALRPRRGDTYESANVETAEIVARAAGAGLARRVLFLSYVGAGAGSPNAYLRAKGRAELALLASGVPTTIFRCAHVVGPPSAPGPTALALRADAGRRVTILGSGRQIVMPVALDDVADALVAALAPGAPTGVYDLTGPDAMTLDDLARLVNVGMGVTLSHVPPWLARLLARVHPELTPALADVLLRDSIGDASAAIRAFGLRPTPLRTLWTPQAAPAVA